MQRIIAVAAVTVVLAAGSAPAQAPDAAGLWRVASGSLAAPAALQTGAASTFWNPAAAHHRGAVTAGVAVLHTADILGVSGLLAAGTVPLTGSLRAGLHLGRMQVRDLVRTTTSPDSEEGTVPVYAQLGGVSLSWGTPRFHVGTSLTLHNAKFDIETSSGVTLDVGVSGQPFPRLTIAGATHFLPIGLSDEPTTDYFGGLEYVVVDRQTLIGLRTRLAVQYGATYRPTGDLEHTMNFAVTLDDNVRVDAAVTRESAYGLRDWRPSVAVTLRFGRFAVSLAHGAGINDAGGTFRVGLDARFPR
ncbi:MAG: hypothetical protein OER90_05340 [Gemmatimonadota bacterium]|nr:hypothetical protein [Gemmatimonadota bacterium]